MDVPDTLWLDAQSPAIFRGQVQWINPVTQAQVAKVTSAGTHQWTGSNTTAIETVDVITNSFGNFTVGQFTPEDLVVGDNETYRDMLRLLRYLRPTATASILFRGRRSKHDGGLLCMDILQKRRTTVLARLQGSL